MGHPLLSKSMAARKLPTDQWEKNPRLAFGIHLDMAWPSNSLHTICALNSSQLVLDPGWWWMVPAWCVWVLNYVGVTEIRFERLIQCWFPFPSCFVLCYELNWATWHRSASSPCTTYHKQWGSKSNLSALCKELSNFVSFPRFWSEAEICYGQAQSQRKTSEVNLCVSSLKQYLQRKHAIWKDQVLKDAGLRSKVCCHRCQLAGSCHFSAPAHCAGEQSHAKQLYEFGSHSMDLRILQKSGS